MLVFSEEEAKKKIYNVSCERYFAFGCDIDEETSNKLEGLSWMCCNFVPLLLALTFCCFNIQTFSFLFN